MSEPPNPSIDDSELHKNCQSIGFEAHKLSSVGQYCGVKKSYLTEHFTVLDPTKHSTDLRPRNPSIDVSGQHKVSQSPDFEARKL